MTATGRVLVRLFVIGFCAAFWAVVIVAVWRANT